MFIPTLPELWRLAAQHHDALKGFVIARARDWHEPAIRRTALQGIAVLTAMIRRLARRVQSARLALRTPPIPAPLWPRLPGGCRNMLDHLARRLTAPDTS